jgi:hypothetical protein
MRDDERPDTDELAAEAHHEERRSRRSLLAGGLGAAGVLVANALGRPAPAEAAGSVQLGATNTAGSVTKIRTTSGSSSGTAIQGEVIASTPGSASVGVRGKNKGSSSTSSGVRGDHSGAGRGVYGTSAHGIGVAGKSSDVAGTGVYGTAPNSISTALGALGVDGLATIGVRGTGEYMGVQGTSANYAVFGFTNPDTAGIGVYGRGAQGVKGRSYTGQAVFGDTDSGIGVKGESYSDGGSVKAVYGQGFGTSNNGVVGEASNGTSAYGVWGISTTGYAGVFSGKVLVTGNLSKGGGSFRIDHPLDPENKVLSHSFVESPDMMNIYNGNVRTGARGTATVRLPAYFDALNRDFRYQLTVIGTFAQAVVAKEIEGNRFVIRTSEPNVKVSWMVTGIRHDPYANRNRIKVVESKPASERGTYLHPKAYGKAARFDAQHARLASLGRRTPKRKRDLELRRPA